MVDFDKWYAENEEELAVAYRDFINDKDDSYFIEFDYDENDWLLDHYEEYLAELSIDE